MGENVLSREELAALLDDGGKGKRERKVVDVDLTRPTRLGADQLRLLTRLHEGLAMRLAAALAPLLRVKLKVELVSLTEQSFSGLRGSLPQASACHLLGLAPLPERGLLILDPKLAAGLIDRMLGGPGSAPEKPKPLTALDRALLDNASRRVLGEWAAAWKETLAFTPAVEAFITEPPELEGIPSAEPLLVASFRLGGDGFTGGECQLGMPLVDLEPALARMTKPVKFAATRRVQTAEQRKHLDSVVGAARLPLVVTLGTTTLTIGEVLALAPGDVLVLDQRQGQPAVGRVAGATRVLGRVGRVGAKLAIAVEKTLPVPPAKKDQP
jgi:flagellar motor switch protein FliM